ncbi:MAG TPA: hypothetical protein VD963_05400 [Phycisphaerales bacterium]|nr:hypothetical protein [Phycisphaerales bacterium]
MTNRGSSLMRLTLAVLAAVWLPLCCCQAGMLVGWTGTLVRGEEAAHACCGCEGAEGRSPGAPAPERDDCPDCAESRSRTATLGERWAPQTDDIGVPAPLPARPTAWVLEQVPAGPGTARSGDGFERAAAGVCWSLVRQRCALII